MILHEETIDAQGGITIKREKSFGIAPAMMGHILKMMSEMYSNPPRAVAREYIANAVDAHRLQRKLHPEEELPNIEIAMPSRLAPTFGVRDYGPGMSEDETLELLSNMGSSGDEKRSSNAFIGGFGIGSKCAFSVADTYTYTVWHGGRRRVYICTMRADAARAIQLIIDEPSGEHSGVLVEVPIKPGDVEGVKQGVAYVQTVLQEPLTISGTPRQVNKVSILDLGHGARLMYSDELSSDCRMNSMVVCGDFVYRLPSNAINGLGYNGVNLLMKFARIGGNESLRANLDMSKCPALSALLHKDALMYFPAGAIRPAPSREDLVFDSAATQLVHNAFLRVKAEVEKELGEVAAASRTPIDVLRACRQLNKLDLGVDIKPLWQGEEIAPKDLPSIKPWEKGEAKLYFLGVKRRRRGADPLILARTVPESLQDLGRPWHTTQTNDTFRGCLLSSVSKASAENGHLYTLISYSVLEAENMSKGAIKSKIFSWWKNKLAEVRQADPDAGYVDTEVVPLDRYVVVMGTKEERAKTLAGIAWATTKVVPDVLQAPPKVPRQPRVPGAPGAPAAQGTSVDYNRGWRKAGAENWEDCKRPEKGPVVYFVGRDDLSSGRAYFRIRETLGDVIPSLKGAELYSLTEVALKALEAKPGHCKPVPLHVAAGKWLEEWAMVGFDKKCVGPELVFWLHGAPSSNILGAIDDFDSKLDSYDIVDPGSFFGSRRDLF